MAGVMKQVVDALKNAPHVTDDNVKQQTAELSKAKQKNEVAVSDFNREMCRLEHGPECTCWKHIKAENLKH